MNKLLTRKVIRMEKLQKLLNLVLAQYAVSKSVLKKINRNLRGGTEGRNFFISDLH